MNIKTDYESPLVLKNIIITEGHFKRNEDSLENLELKVGAASPPLLSRSDSS